MARALGRRAAQSTVEYMLVISVLVIGLWAAAQALVPGLSEGLESMSTDVQSMTEAGYVGGGQ
jgi:hypothetical protein